MTIDADEINKRVSEAVPQGLPVHLYIGQYLAKAVELIVEELNKKDT